MPALLINSGKSIKMGILWLLLIYYTLNSVAFTHSSIVRIYTQGISPFETDVLLPYSIIQKLYQQQLAGNHQNTKIHAVFKTQNKIIKKYRQSRNLRNVRKGQLYFQRDRFDSRNFELYDDDGDQLLSFKYPNILAAQSIRPFIVNTTSTYINERQYDRNRNYKEDNSRLPKKLIQHVWIKLK